MKVVFMGTPDFAVPALNRLIKEHEVICVYTQEPKIAGRGNKICKTPVHLTAEQYGIEVRTPRSFKNEEEREKFVQLGADVAVVAAYGVILPLPIIEAYPLGCLNIHASLLPRWRGAAPIQRAIEAGDAQSGVTIMQVAQGLDTGDMLLKGEVPITSSTTGGVLHDALAELGAQLMSAVLADPQKYTPLKQDDSLACYAAKIDKAECLIDWRLPAAQLAQKIKAFSPYPGMFFSYQGERFKVLDADKKEASAQAGEIIEAHDHLVVACGQNALNIKIVQRQGKKAMPISDLLRGFSFDETINLQAEN